MAIHEFLIIATLILISGLFAMTELALLSCSRAKLEQMGLAGDTRADSALKLLESPTTFLTTMQMRITVLSIVTGIYCGTGSGPRFGEFLSQSIFEPSYSVLIEL